MKIKNIGEKNFMLIDKRGNFRTLEPSCTIDVDDNIGRKLVKVYSCIEEVKEVKVEEKKAVVVEEKVEEKKEVEDVKSEVSRETKKKKGKK